MQQNAIEFQFANSKNLTPNDLLEIIDQDWASQIGANDPRFSNFLPPFHGSLLEQVNSFIRSSEASESDVAILAESLPSIMARVYEISNLSLEKSLSELLMKLTTSRGERLSAISDRLGWSGIGPITLEEAGQRIGVTPARAYQIQSDIAQNLSKISFPLYLPALDEALSFVRNRAPSNFKDAEDALQYSGISESRYTLEALIKTAKLCGRELPFEVLQGNDRKLVVDQEVPMEMLGLIGQIARRHASASGVSNTSKVVIELAKKGTKISDYDVKKILEIVSSLEFIDDSWFYFSNLPKNRDRLRNTCRKILSIVSPLSVDVMRDGISRFYKFQSHRGSTSWPLIVPPSHVLLEYCNRQEEFEVFNKKIGAGVLLDYRTELSETERIIVDVLRSSPGCVLDRSTIWERCAQHGMNGHTLNVYLSVSPVICSYGTGIWSLRGVQLDPGAIEEVRMANSLRPKKIRAIDFGWIRNRVAWIAVRVPESKTNFEFSIPADIRQFVIEKKFDVRDRNSQSYGKISVNSSGKCYGTLKFLTENEAVADELLFIEFDLVNFDATLYLGDEESLQQIKGQT